MHSLGSAAMRLFFLAVILLLPSASWACLNDSDTRRFENEFRSQYTDAPSPSTAPASDSYQSSLPVTHQWDVRGLEVAGIGGLLLYAGLSIARHRFR
jgi:hypothetical protein